MLTALVLSAALQAAVSAQDRGDHQAAAKLYEDAWTAGAKNGHVAYNLGVAYYRQERLGDAMAAFLKARELLPRDPDVAANLKLVASKIPDRLEPEIPKGAAAAATAWLGRLTPREYAWTAAVLAGLVGLGLVLAQLVKPLKSMLKPLLAALALPGLALAALGFRLTQAERWGAVAAPTARVHAAPGAETTLFELRAGAPFALAEERDGWVRILLSDGKKGWIAGRDVKVLR